MVALPLGILTEKSGGAVDTVTITAEDVLPANTASPLNCAVIVCGPTARADVWKVVTTESKNADVPMVLPPSLKVAVCPAGAVRVPFIVKVAVKVTLLP